MGAQLRGRKEINTIATRSIEQRHSNNDG